MLVKQLKTQHPDYDPSLLTKYELLYEGGDSFLKQTVLFLPKRNAEAAKLYNERLSRAFYVGYVGPIIDYFISNLFAFNANIGNKDKATAFYKEFFADCDLKGTEFNKFFQQSFVSTLVHRNSYLLLDFPRLNPDEPLPTSLKDQQERNLLRAYLVQFNKKDLIDWQYDERGNYKWVKFYCQERFKPDFDSKELKRHMWYIYTQTDFQIFQYDEDPDKNEDEELREAELILTGSHSLPGQVPVCNIEVPKGLWIMNKLASIQVELFNLDNAMAWQEYQAHYCMPIIKLKDGKDFKQKLGEAYFIKLEVDESFEWSEPEGKMMAVGLQRREMLKDEMYRIVHQLSLSVKQTKSQTRQSGNSKQEDRYATEVVLRAFGDVVRDSMQKILMWISYARGEDIEWDVSGFNTFDTDSMTEKLAQILQLRAINIHSETFAKEMEKRAVDEYLEDLNHETKTKIKAEIDKFDFDQIINDPLLGLFGSTPKNTPGSSSFAQKGQSPNRTNSNKPY